MKIIGNVFGRSRRARTAKDAAAVVAVGSDGEITAPLEMPFSLPCDTIVVDPTVYATEERRTPRVAKGSDNLPAPLPHKPRR